MEILAERPICPYCRDRHPVTMFSDDESEMPGACAFCRGVCPKPKAISCGQRLSQSGFDIGLCPCSTKHSQYLRYSWLRKARQIGDQNYADLFVNLSQFYHRRRTAKGEYLIHNLFTPEECDQIKRFINKDVYFKNITKIDFTPDDNRFVFL